MRMSHLLSTLALTLAIVSPAPTAPPTTKGIHASKAAKAVKPAPIQHHHHVLHGVVIEVKHTKSHEGTFKIQLPAHHHHKKASISARAAATKKHHHRIVTIHVTQHTKFRKVWHQAGKVHHQQAIFAELHKGEHVRVVLAHHHHALDVDIHVKAPVTSAAAAKTVKPPIKIKKK